MLSDSVATAIMLLLYKGKARIILIDPTSFPPIYRNYLSKQPFGGSFLIQILFSI